MVNDEQKPQTDQMLHYGGYWKHHQDKFLASPHSATKQRNCLQVVVQNKGTVQNIVKLLAIHRGPDGISKVMVA